MAPRNIWTPEAVESLHALWGMYASEAVCRMINERHGTAYTLGAVRKKASVLGIHADYNQGFTTVTEIARAVGVHQSAVVKWLIRNGVRTRIRGRCRAVPSDAVARITAHYAPPPEPVMSTREAARRLSYSYVYVNKLASDGRIRSYRYKENRVIAVAEVSRLLMERHRAAA